jgi:hypothetical protein
MDGLISNTTSLIKSATVEKRNVRVYCASAVSSKRSSSRFASNANSTTPRIMTEIGLSSTNCAKTLPSNIIVTSQRNPSLLIPRGHNAIKWTAVVLTQIFVLPPGDRQPERTTTKNTKGTKDGV